jgi:hypothetical protein
VSDKPRLEERNLADRLRALESRTDKSQGLLSLARAMESVTTSAKATLGLKIKLKAA